jgi:hypothetical protein
MSPATCRILRGSDAAETFASDFVNYLPQADDTAISKKLSDLREVTPGPLSSSRPSRQIS